MRTKYAVKNISMNLISQFVIIILGFISRKVFIDNLSTEYLGINGVLTNILSMMVLIESGIGISIVYNLYKPLSEEDKEKICALVKLYKKAYIILATIMLLFSYGIYPFLNKLMKTDSDIPFMFVVYSIFVIKNAISYLNAYKWALINADQKGYLLSRNNLIFQVVTTIAKIVILIKTKNYILFLAIELIVFIIQNIVNTITVRKLYPYLDNKYDYKIDKDTKNNITKNVKAMFLHNIGGYLVNSTDNLLIASFVNVATVGLYSNYTMVTTQLSALLGPIIGGIGVGVGNLIATEDKEKVYEIFNVSYFLSFWIYSFATIFLYVLLEPFINWWIGTGYLLEKFVFIFILVNFYISGMRGVVGNYKSKAGLFVQDKYAPVFEGLVNLIASIILMQRLGLVGVFIGTTISTLLVPFWNQPRILYKNLFKKSVWIYFRKYIFYLLLTLIIGLGTSSVCNLFIDGYSFISLCERGIICLIIPNIIYLVLFYKTEEFKYLLGALKSQISNIGVLNKILKLS